MGVSGAGLLMWADADLHEGHTVLEIGTGTCYSTALACERLGSADITSIVYRQVFGEAEA